MDFKKNITLPSLSLPGFVLYVLLCFLVIILTSTHCLYLLGCCREGFVLPEPTEPGGTDSLSGHCQMRRRFRSYSREIDVNTNSFQKLGTKKRVSSRLFWGIWEYRFGMRGVWYSSYHFMLFIKSSKSSQNFRSGLAYPDLFKQVKE